MVRQQDENRVFWSDELRARVYPRRGGMKVSIKALAPTAELLGRCRDHQDTWRQTVVSIGHHVTRRGVAAAELQAQIARRLADVEPRGALSVADDAALLAAFAGQNRSHFKPEFVAPLELLVAQGGVQHAVAACLTALELRLVLDESTHHYRVQARAAAGEFEGSLFHAGNLLGLDRLRALLVAAPLAEYQQARAAAAVIRGQGTSAQRAAAAFLFPDAADWVREDIALAEASVGCAASLLSSVADAELLRLVPRAWPVAFRPHDGRVGATLLDGCAVAAGPFLAGMNGAGAPMALEDCAWLAAVGCDATLQLLVKHLPEPKALKALAEAAANQPQRVLRLVAPLAVGRAKTAAAARMLCARVLCGHPGMVEALLPAPEAKTKAYLQRLREECAPALDEAEPHELPAVLRDGGARIAPAVVRAVAAVEVAEAMCWREGEREGWLARNDRSRFGFNEAGWAKLASSDAPVLVEMLAFCPVEHFAALLPRVRKVKGVDAQYYPLLAARHGLAALSFLESVGLAQVIDLLAPYAVARLAPLMAKAHARNLALKAGAERWLLRHPEHAAAGLIGQAFGKVGAGRSDAEAALRLLAGAGHAATVREVARRAGVADEMEMLLRVDAACVLPAKLPQLPAWAQARALVRPQLRQSRRVLPVAATEKLLTLLAVSPLEQPCAALEQIKEACEPTALARFVWSLFEAWLMHGAPAREMWCMYALGHFGSNDTARHLAALVREWPGESAHARAVSGLHVLAAMGTDVALLHLNGIALKSKFKGLQRQAEQKIAQVAAARGFTPDELDDRLAPDLGLDSDGALRLDFGPRAFVVGFDEQLRPMVRDEAGVQLKELPKPRASDDAAQAEAALACWRQLKKDAKTAASQQILRLELCMCSKRRLSSASFVDLVVRHPLVFHLARRLVWGIYDACDQLLQTFRIAEDRTFADVNDESWSLPEASQVGVVHPLELEAQQLRAWSQIFADLELLQPFQQLGRLLFAPDEAERMGTELKRVQGLKVATVKLRGLEQRRWRRGTPGDAGIIEWVEKQLPGGSLARLDFDLAAGVYGSVLALSDGEQQLGVCRVLNRPCRWDVEPEACTPLGELDPIVFSELVRDLESLRG